MRSRECIRENRAVERRIADSLHTLQKEQKQMQVTQLLAVFFLHYHIIITVKPELAVTFIKQPTCLKQIYRMFLNFNFVLIFTTAKHRFDCIYIIIIQLH